MPNQTDDEDDPFACFGDDEDDEDDDDDDEINNIANNNNHKEENQDTEEDERTKRKRLIERANQRLRPERNGCSTSHTLPPSSTQQPPPSVTAKVQQPLPSPIDDLWPDRPPLYLGPMIVVFTSNDGDNDGNETVLAKQQQQKQLERPIGGNRGYVATRDIPPGTLLLVEQPIFTWPPLQIGEELGLSSVLELFRDDNDDDDDGNNHYDRKGKQRNENHQQRNTTNQKKDGGVVWRGQRIVWDMEHLHPTRERVDALCRYRPTTTTTTTTNTNNNNDITETKKSDSNNDHNKIGDKQEDVEPIQIIQMMEQMRTKFSSDPLLPLVLNLARRHNVVTNRRQQPQPRKSAGGDGGNNQNDNPLGVGNRFCAFDETDVYRTMLALRYNGFGSGVYLHFSMLNHCDRSNCVKYAPSDNNNNNNTNNSNNNDDTNQQKNLGQNNTIPQTKNVPMVTMHHEPKHSSSSLLSHRTYSELRATRWIRRGEALTLHYLENPREVSHATRRRHLWDQHRFDIGPVPLLTDGVGIDGVGIDGVGADGSDGGGRGTIDTMELVNGVVPPSSIEPTNGKKHDGESDSNDDPTQNVENALIRLEELYQDSSTAVAVATTASFSNSESAATKATLEQTLSLETATYELISAATKRLNNDRHLLLIRCCRLHLDVVDSLLRILERQPPPPSQQQQHHDGSGRSNDGDCGPSANDDTTIAAASQRRTKIDLTCRFLPSCQKLLSLQLSYLGPDHPDVARTYLDLATGIGGLLAVSPRRLFVLGLVSSSSFLLSSSTMPVTVSRSSSSCSSNNNNNTIWLDNFHRCSMEENRCRKEYERIRDLYPRDLEERMVAYRSSIDRTDKN